MVPLKGWSNVDLELSVVTQRLAEEVSGETRALYGHARRFWHDGSSLSFIVALQIRSQVYYRTARVLAGVEPE